jgi:hypothetical protein
MDTIQSLVIYQTTLNHTLLKLTNDLFLKKRKRSMKWKLSFFEKVMTINKPLAYIKEKRKGT